MTARRHKVLDDLWDNKTRTLLVVLSIALGVICVGTVLGARTIILSGLATQYDAANPAAATLQTAPLGDSALATVRHVPGVRLVEGRTSVPGRIRLPNGSWKDLVLFAIPDFRRQALQKVQRDGGAWPPPLHQLLIERASLATFGLRRGESVRVEMPNGRQQAMVIAGSAHDIIQPATSVSGIAYGYVAVSTLAWLGGLRDFNQVYLAVTGNTRDRAHIGRVAARVRSTLERSGHHVLATVIPEPGKLWVYDAVQSMLLLLSILGVFSLCMSGFLVVNTVSAHMTRQVPQIGIMKAIGGGPRQIAGMYLMTILGFCALALLVAIPLGLIGSLALISYSTTLLDFDTGSFALSPQVLGVEFLAGVAVPLLAALVPILNGSRVTVREALASYGIGGRNDSVINLDEGPAWLRAVPQVILFSLGNTVRRKGRLLLTLTALVLGGAIFVAVLSVRSSLIHTLDDVFGYRNYDVQVTFSHPYPDAHIRREAMTVPGVVGAEGWAEATAHRTGRAAVTTADISLVAPRPGSTLIKPVILHGRWLHPTDSHRIVVNSDMVADEHDLQVGQPLTLLVDGRVTSWTIAGIVRGVQEGPGAYVNYPALTRITGTAGYDDRLQVVTARHDASYQERTARTLEERLKRAGLQIDSTQPTSDQRAILGANFDIIVTFLLVMAILLAVVGGLGLMGTMSINVLERTREIGILRAVGASNRDLLQIVLTEGLIVAALSWLVGVLASIPLSPMLTAAVGSAFIHAPLHYSFALGGAALWLIGVLVLAALASWLPARNASRLTVRDVLAYE